MKYTKGTIESIKVIKAIYSKFLLEIVNGDLSNVVSSGNGLCSNLKYQSFALYPSIKQDDTLVLKRGESYVFVSENCRDWGGFNGSTNWPINEDEYTCYKWQGESLKQRQSLAKHLLKCLDSWFYTQYNIPYASGE